MSVGFTWVFLYDGDYHRVLSRGLCPGGSVCGWSRESTTRNGQVGGQL